MIETYHMSTGVYDKDVTTGLFNLRIDNYITGQWYKILKEGKRSFSF